MKQARAQDIIASVRSSYSAIAQEFDLTRQRPWKEFEAFLPYVKKGARILDLGCGNGRLCDFLSPHGIRYVGVDHNEEMIKIARLNHPSAQFEMADMADMKIAPKGRADMELFATSSFDMVFCVASFHHLPGRSLRRKTLDDIHALLQHDGVLILTVWNLFQWKYCRELLRAFFASLFSLGERGAWNDVWVKWGDYPVKRYYHAFLPRELSRLFGRGWKIEDFYFTRKGERVTFWKSFNLVLVARKSQSSSFA